MKRLAIINSSILCLLFNFWGFAQNPKKTDSTKTTINEKSIGLNKKSPIKSDFPDWKKLYFGGNVGAYFGTDITIVELSPLVGYKLTDEFSAGVGITYMYMKDYFGPANIYGGRIFGRYNLFENVFAYAEYEALDIPFQPLYAVNKEYRKTIYSPMVGGGYSQSMGENAHFVIMGLWNLNQTLYSPYPNPIIRMGFVLGI